MLTKPPVPYHPSRGLLRDYEPSDGTFSSTNKKPNVAGVLDLLQAGSPGQAGPHPLHPHGRLQQALLQTRQVPGDRKHVISYLSYVIS